VLVPRNLTYLDLRFAIDKEGEHQVDRYKIFAALYAKKSKWWIELKKNK
jgi:hypothetical protein